MTRTLKKLGGAPALPDYQPVRPENNLAVVDVTEQLTSPAQDATTAPIMAWISADAFYVEMIGRSDIREFLTRLAGR